MFGVENLMFGEEARMFVIRKWMFDIETRMFDEKTLMSDLEKGMFDIITRLGNLVERKAGFMFDINEPVTNPALVEAIEAIEKDSNQSSQNNFFNAVKAAKFLTSVSIDPPPPPGEDGKTTLKADTIISFVHLQDANDDVFLPVYTDWFALKLWRDIPDERTMILTYEDIRAMVVANEAISGFVINPYSNNITIRKDMLAILDAGHAKPWTVEEDTQVRIGLPSNDPVEIKEAISGYLKYADDAKSAYLVLMEKEGESSFLIIVDFEGDRQKMFNGIASVAVPLLREGELIDMAPADSDIGRSVIEGFPPFYEKK